MHKAIIDKFLAN